MVNIENRLKRLEEKGATLAEACEGINDTIAKIESRISEAGIGLKAEIELSLELEREEEGRRFEKMTCLSYERHGQELGLWVQDLLYRYDLEAMNDYEVIEKWAPRRLSDCSLQIRILALDRIGALFDKLEGVIDSSVETVREAKKNTEA